MAIQVAILLKPGAFKQAGRVAVQRDLTLELMPLQAATQPTGRQTLRIHICCSQIGNRFTKTIAS